MEKELKKTKEVKKRKNIDWRWIRERFKDLEERKRTMQTVYQKCLKHCRQWSMNVYGSESSSRKDPLLWCLIECWFIIYYEWHWVRRDCAVSSGPYFERYSLACVIECVFWLPLTIALIIDCFVNYYSGLPVTQWSFWWSVNLINK